MSNCLIAYFSLGGTTSLIADRIAAGLRRADCHVDLERIAKDRFPGVDGYGMLGVGTPVYYYRAPFIVQDFLESLPDLNGLPVFIFLLHGTYPWETGAAIGRVLQGKGGRPVGYYRSYGVEHWVGYLREGYIFSPGHPNVAELEGAEDFGHEMANAVNASRRMDWMADRSAPLLYRIERLLTCRRLATSVYSRLFRVDRALCDSCGLCAELCPTGNVSLDSEGLPTWGRYCLLCLSCELKCSRNAISSPAGWRILKPIISYNARSAARDPSIDHIKVDPRTWLPPDAAADSQ